MNIIIKRLNESFCKVLTDDRSVLTYLSQVFSYSVNRQYKSNYSSSAFNLKTNELPVGLWYKAYVALEKKYGSVVVIDPELNLYQDIDQLAIKDWTATLSLPAHIVVKPHQYHALESFVQYRRYTLLASTSSGKSLMSYLMLRYATDHLSVKRCLIIVPRIGLVSQLVANFQEYGCSKMWVDALGKEKIVATPIVVSTWQGLQKVSPDWFNQFDMVVVDECHTAKAKVIMGILNACTTAKIRIGMTGSLHDEPSFNLMIEGLFGSIIEVMSAKESQDLGLATPIKIFIKGLYYNANDCQAFVNEKKALPSKQHYPLEVEFINRNQRRSAYLRQLVLSLKGNVLVLFSRKESHLMEEAKRLMIENEKNVFIITGDVSVNDRLDIKKALECSDGNILLATMETFKMGESVNRLHWLVLAHSSKSVITIIQSLGRLMRLHESKEFAGCIDLVDILSNEKTPNYSYDHALNRLEYYAQQGYKDCEIEDVWL